MAKDIPKTARQLEKETSSPRCIPRSLMELVEHGVSPRCLGIKFKINQRNEHSYLKWIGNRKKKTSLKD